MTRVIICLAVASSVAITAPSAGLDGGQIPGRLAEALQKIDVARPAHVYTRRQRCL